MMLLIKIEGNIIVGSHIKSIGPKAFYGQDYSSRNITVDCESVGREAFQGVKANTITLGNHS